MSLELNLQSKITEECLRSIGKYHAYHNYLHLDWLRNASRIKNPPTKIIKEPSHWSIDQKFNPFYVQRNASAIARSIARKIEISQYTPNAPHLQLIPKPGGGERQLTIYQIPDAAVSSLFYSRLLTKNRHRFSSFSYAYRNDRNVHFAIQDIAIDLTQNARTFIAEFDFSDFFGSIDHKYLYAQLDKNGFFITEEEKSIIQAFLSTRERGIPQGTSLSLFLANLVCWKLDKSLERGGLRFARYADDTVIWSQSYEAICEAFNIVNTFSTDAGVSINLKKSDGINLLSKEGSVAEMSSKEFFDFLGYSISTEKVSMKLKTVRRIKKEISYLLYRNLIQPLQSTPIKAMVIPANGQDRSLLVAMSKIRRYLYGGLLNRDLIDYVKGRKNSIHFKGVMSFYPLLDDEEQLRELDGWLASTIHRSVQKRSDLLVFHGFNQKHNFPFNVKQDQLLDTYKRKRIKGKRLLEVPSFFLVIKALKRGLLEKGIERVMHPESSKYNYSE